MNESNSSLMTEVILCVQNVKSENQCKNQFVYKRDVRKRKYLTFHTWEPHDIFVKLGGAHPIREENLSLHVTYSYRKDSITIY